MDITRIIEVFWNITDVLFVLGLPTLIMIVIGMLTKQLDEKLSKTGRWLFLINTIILILIYLPQSFLSETNTPDYDSLIIMTLLWSIALIKKK